MQCDRKKISTINLFSSSDNSCASKHGNIDILASILCNEFCMSHKWRLKKITVLYLEVPENVSCCNCRSRKAIVGFDTEFHKQFFF